MDVSQGGKDERLGERAMSKMRISVNLTHHKVAAEVVFSPLLVPLAHGLHPLNKLSQDAGLVHL